MCDKDNGRNFKVKPAQRDAFISDQLERLIARVRAGEAPAKDRYRNERDVLERLIPIETDGFRGITLTAILGKFVREDIDTSNEFGSINPRPIFENGIRPVLKRHRVPTGQSAPLNVAKNVQVIDEKWAEGRKPEAAALAAVDYIRRINRHWSNEQLRDALILMFIERLLEYADEVALLTVELAPLDHVAPVQLGLQLARYAMKNQEGGATPQLLFGLVLEQLRDSDSRYSKVVGVNSSVFGTNTTSNKPADVWELLHTGVPGNLFEVTCKTVDLDRLDAAVDSFALQKLPNAPISFVCRIPRDVITLALVDSQIVHRGVTFQFLDFEQVIHIVFSFLPVSSRQKVVDGMVSFVGEPSRSQKAKMAWADAFGLA
ncbi:hypothetical protein WAB17_10005 [Parerythrobacter aurantius]|uniref:hypothetical protein n=1 Tax=Parerythrobacter aurantius TaxID=3127706 RepID=UPI00324FEBC5